MKMKNIDKYFYSVELDDNGKNIIHLFGDVYFNDSDETETNHRCSEWTGMYIPIDRLKDLISSEQFFSYVYEHVDYVSDITESEAIKLCEEYFNGHPGTYLNIGNVDENTPCGDYWF